MREGDVPPNGPRADDVRRRVKIRPSTGGQRRTVIITRRYPTTAEDLWDACTTAERIGRWLMPISGELRPGGHYALTGNASGTIEWCDPPHGLRATWEFGGRTSWIELRLSELGDGSTELELAHVAPSDDDHWEQFGPGAVGVGWELALSGLSMHLAPGPDPDPDAAARWAASADGRRFIAASSDAWREASAAAGTDPRAAAAAAERTTAFYTGS